jgi:hypothetical protein
MKMLNCRTSCICLLVVVIVVCTRKVYCGELTLRDRVGLWCYVRSCAVFIGACLCMSWLHQKGCFYDYLH